MELLEYSKNMNQEGEYVLIICGKNRDDIKGATGKLGDDAAFGHMKHYESQGIDRKEAMKRVAKDRGVSKRDIYRQLLDE